MAGMTIPNMSVENQHETQACKANQLLPGVLTTLVVNPKKRHCLMVLHRIGSTLPPIP
jgi:hypothetical protein